MQLLKDKEWFNSLTVTSAIVWAVAGFVVAAGWVPESTVMMAIDRLSELGVIVGLRRVFGTR